MVKIISHRKNTNGSRGTALHTYGTAKTQQTGHVACAKGVDLSLTAAEDVQWCGHFGKQPGSFLNSYTQASTQRSQSTPRYLHREVRTYIPKRPAHERSQELYLSQPQWNVRRTMWFPYCELNCTAPTAHPQQALCRLASMPGNKCHTTISLNIFQETPNKCQRSDLLMVSKVNKSESKMNKSPRVGEERKRHKCLGP